MTVLDRYILFIRLRGICIATFFLLCCTTPKPTRQIWPCQWSPTNHPCKTRYNNHQKARRRTIKYRLTHKLPSSYWETTASCKVFTTGYWKFSTQAFLTTCMTNKHSLQSNAKYHEVCIINTKLGNCIKPYQHMEWEWQKYFMDHHRQMHFQLCYKPRQQEKCVRHTSLCKQLTYYSQKFNPESHNPISYGSQMICS